MRLPNAPARRRLGAVALLAATIACGPATADAVSDFYTGKSITIIVGYTPGGTYDAIARLLARHMPAHIPGKPTMIVKNMPGAGSLTAINNLYSVAAKDGTVLGVVGRSYPTEPVLNPSKPRYNPARFEPIGSTSPETTVSVTWHTSRFKTFQDMMKQEATIGAAAAKDDTGRYPLIAKNLTGAKMRLIFGYPGGTEIVAAVERGEVDARFGWSWGSVKSRSRDLLEQKKITIILQQGMKKAPDLPDVPFIMDFAKTDLDRAALEFLFAPLAAAWPMIAPPDVPKERIAALRAAYKATMTDPQFIASAEKQRIEIEPISGEEMAEINARMSKVDQKVIDRANELTAVER